MPECAAPPCSLRKLPCSKYCRKETSRLLPGWRLENVVNSGIGRAAMMYCELPEESPDRRDTAKVSISHIMASEGKRHQHRIQSYAPPHSMFSSCFSGSPLMCTVPDVQGIVESICCIAGRSLVVQLEPKETSPATCKEAKTLILLGMNDPFCKLGILLQSKEVLMHVWKHLDEWHRLQGFVQRDRRGVRAVLNNITWPEPRGLDINMMPFHWWNAEETLPAECLRYWHNILSRIRGMVLPDDDDDETQEIAPGNRMQVINNTPTEAYDSDDRYEIRLSSPPADLPRPGRMDVAYLTIQESPVLVGMSHRRPGLHMETLSSSLSYRTARDIKKSFDDIGRARWQKGMAMVGDVQYDYDSGQEGLGHIEYGVPAGGIYMGSNVARSCRVWDCQIANPGTVAGPLGCLEHLREHIGTGKYMRPDTVYWLSGTIHATRIGAAARGDLPPVFPSGDWESQRVGCRPIHRQPLGRAAGS